MVQAAAYRAYAIRPYNSRKTKVVKTMWDVGKIMSDVGKTTSDIEKIISDLFSPFANLWETNSYKDSSKNGQVVATQRLAFSRAFPHNSHFAVSSSYSLSMPFVAVVS